MSWQWDGKFQAIHKNELGEITVHKFTSSAQARQHVENKTGTVLAHPVRNHRPKRAHNRATGRQMPLKVLTPEQQKQKDAAMRQLTFKK